MKIMNLPLPFKAMPEFVKDFFTDKLGPIKWDLSELKLELYQSEIDLKAEDYAKLCIGSSIYTALITILGVSIISLILGDISFLVIGFISSLIVGAYSLTYCLKYPIFITKKRIKKLEFYLMPALRHIMIKIRSGVSLFRAIVGLCEDYGELSKEMKIVVDKTNAGVPLAEALDESATKNPSDHFRRAIWQISSTLKAGADINKTLSSIVESFSDDQLLVAKKYGRELNFWSVIYLVFSIVFPTLVLSFLVVLSTFLGFIITFSTLILFLILVLISQFLFFSLLKSRKPLLVG
ncbi:MAG: hypothetical protein GF368_00010 [Candidatus Aenigmarchaeota archaeon]|nr:hypothetical protein [Candidatus Aenigmarchaeota archaeon]